MVDYYILRSQFDLHKRSKDHFCGLPSNCFGGKLIAFQSFRNRRSLILLQQVTYRKRKRGLLKKLMEFTILCGVDVHIIMSDVHQGKYIQYMNDRSVSKLVKPSSALHKKIKESLTNEDVSLTITYLNVQKRLKSICCSLRKKASKKRIPHAFPKTPKKNQRTNRLAPSISAMVFNINRKSAKTHMPKIKWAAQMTIKRMTNVMVQIRIVTR
ncbi:hypothetical protein FGO68_gene12333 [Halteria grandinella]|uniref:MADS-box domain-containing protein n=1 Tax=Halteria grandinella TaxID=5974 RepID=A0A8J8T5K4_HALGN|nr:hypothetical protein FGO68_gene12333 [Halteria grandinella]